MIKFSCILILFLSSINAIAAPMAKFGDDTRKFHADVSKEIQNYGKSVGAIFLHLDEIVPEASEMSTIKRNDDGNFSVITTLFQEDIKATLPNGEGNVCKDHYLYNKKVAASCSVFLISSNQVATAGHCLKPFSKGADNKFSLTQNHTPNTKNIEIFKIVFNDFVSEKKLYPVSKDNVYTVKRIVKARYNQYWGDYAILELDRNVKGVKPLKLPENIYSRTMKEIYGFMNKKRNLLAIGHAHGAPLVYTDLSEKEFEYQHYDDENYHFVQGWKTPLDLAEGMSGGPLIDLDTGEVIAINVSYEGWKQPKSFNGFVLNESNKCYEEANFKREDSPTFSVFIDYALRPEKPSFAELIFTGAFERSEGLPTISSMINNNVNVNAKARVLNGEETTPLYYAALRYFTFGRKDSFEYLLRNGAKVDTRTLLLMGYLKRENDDGTLFDVLQSN